MLRIFGHKNKDFIRYFYYLCELDLIKRISYQKGFENILACVCSRRSCHPHWSAGNPASSGADFCDTKDRKKPFRKDGR